MGDEVLILYFFAPEVIRRVILPNSKEFRFGLPGMDDSP